MLALGLAASIAAAVEAQTAEGSDQAQEMAGLYRLRIDPNYHALPPEVFKRYLDEAPVVRLGAKTKAIDRVAMGIRAAFIPEPPDDVANKSLNEALQFRFGMTPSSPNYQPLIESLLLVNEVSSVKDLEDLTSEGRLSIPAIPRSFTSDKEVKSAGKLGFGKLEQVEESHGINFNTDPFLATFSPNRPIDIYIASESQLEGLPEVSRPVPVSFAQAICYPQNCPGAFEPHAYAPPTELNEALAAASPLRSSVLIVLDSGFPDLHERLKSFRHFRRLGTDYWERYSLLSQATKYLLTEPEPAASQEADSIGHAACVKDSLAALDATNQGPEIFYLPLRPTEGTERLFRDLLTRRAFEDRLSTLIDPHDPANKKDLQLFFEESREEASHILKRFSAAQSLNPSLVLTDRAFLEALYLTLDLESKASATSGVFVVNHSWLVARPLRVSPPTSPHGIAVAALGNSASELGSASSAFPALSCLTSSFFLPVSNGELSDSYCCSNSLAPSVSEVHWSARFDGRSGSRCGTSFSSPRAAWLTAAVGSRIPLQPGESWLLAFERQRQRLNLPSKVLDQSAFISLLGQSQH